MTEYVYPQQFMADQAAGRKVILCEPPAVPPLGGCPNCGEMGYLYAFYVKGGPYKSPPREAAAYVDGEGWYAGNRQGIACPICNGGKLAEFLARNCGLRQEDLSLHFDNYRPRPGNEDARSVAAHLLSMTPLPAGFVTYYGDYGVGKSRLLMTLVNGFRRANVYAVYARLADLLAEVRSGFGDNNPTQAAESLLARFQDVRCLAIDEVGPDKVNLTPWARETVFRLLDGRYANMKVMLTVLASNTPPEQLGVDWGYVGSRMMGGIVCLLSGDDIRPAVGAQEKSALLGRE